MSWSLDRTNGIWKCSNYSDLNYGAIMNLAEYGQPMSPYEPGYDYVFERSVDFSNVTVEMPQSEVMTHGFGRGITPYNFPIVYRFLAGFSRLPYGIYYFRGLVMNGFAQDSDRRIKTNLYGFSIYNIDSGDLDPADAAYIYGDIGFALQEETRFICDPRFRRVEAVIGALNDNWDYESGNCIIQLLEPLVAATTSPDHYNLEKPINILFRGTGKRVTVEHRIHYYGPASTYSGLIRCHVHR